jgi:hypothetical protein
LNRFQAASAIVFALSTLTLAAQCGSVDGGTAGKPFRAEFHCRDTQTLANGAQVVRENSGVVARDGEGRTYVKTSPHGLNMPVSVYVHDWAKGTTTAWQEPKEGDSGKQDSVRMTATLLRGVPVIARPQTAAEEKALLESTMCPKQPQENLTCEDLGTRTIAGVVAHGTMQQRTVPVGESGNNAPFVVTYERWYSPELRVMVEGTTNDPRDGEHTMVVDSIDQSEPPASLFEVPQGYTVHEQPKQSQ